MYTEDEEEEEEETQEGYSCVDSTDRLEVTCGKETRVFLHNEGHQRTHSYSEEFISHEESLNEEESEEKHYSEMLSLHNSPQVSDLENEEVETSQVDFPERDPDSVPNSAQVERRTTSPLGLSAYKRNKNRDGISSYR